MTSDQKGDSQIHDALMKMLVKPEQKNKTRCKCEPDVKPVKILLIEIRNSEDTDVTNAPSRALHPDGSLHAGLLQQLGMPLQGFWNAGHVSVTGRDRNGLDLLIASHPKDLEIHQVILDDTTDDDGGKHWIKVASDPLSWSLTPAEREEVRDHATDGRIAPCYADVGQWFEHFDAEWEKQKEYGTPPKRCRGPAIPVTTPKR